MQVLRHYSGHIVSALLQLYPNIGLEKQRLDTHLSKLMVYSNLIDKWTSRAILACYVDRICKREQFWPSGEGKLVPQYKITVHYQGIIHHSTIKMFIST